MADVVGSGKHPRKVRSQDHRASEGVDEMHEPDKRPEGQHLHESIEADYLFQTRTGLVEFVVVEEEMARLNDYCVVASRAVHHEVSQLHRRKVELEQGPAYYDWEDGAQVHRSELLMGLVDFEIPSWEEAYTFISPATQLLLLHVLVERSLKSICAEYDPANSCTFYGGHTVNVKAKGGQSKLRSYLNFLNETCGLQVVTPMSTEYLDDKVRILRNAFAHGDWDEVKVLLSSIGVRQAFESASELFVAIETARARE